MRDIAEADRPIVAICRGSQSLVVVDGRFVTSRQPSGGEAYVVATVRKSVGSSGSGRTRWSADAAPISQALDLEGGVFTCWSGRARR